MHRSARSFLPALASLAVLVFASWQAATTLANTPAFNNQLRVEVPEGGTRPLLVQSMYDHAGYLYQVGYGYAHSLAFASKPGLSNPETLLETIRGNFNLSRTHTEASLNRNPANAHAWTVLATSLRALSQKDAALEAYRNSIALAPYSGTLATSRLRFVSKADARVRAEPEVMVAIERDIRVLARSGPRAVEYATRDLPEFKDNAQTP